MTFLYFRNDCTQLGIAIGKKLVVRVFPYHRQVGGNTHNVDVVYGVKFVFFGFGSTRHTAQLVVQTEVVLESDCCQGFVFFLDGDVFLCFDCLMQTAVEPSALHFAPRESIYDDDLTFFHDVVTIALHYRVGPECVVDVGV